MTKAADRVVYFIENHIKHIKGELGGQPFKLEPFQKTIVRDLFGWKYRDSGLRRFRTAYICLPRKNGKSTLISAIALYMLLADNEPSAECYIAAGDRQQAGIIFDVASGMVRADNQLNKNLKVFKTLLSTRKATQHLRLSVLRHLVSLDTTLVSFVWMSSSFRKTLVCGMP